jgi:hypothetical protein
VISVLHGKAVEWFPLSPAPAGQNPAFYGIHIVVRIRRQSARRLAAQADMRVAAHIYYKREAPDTMVGSLQAVFYLSMS